MPAQASGIEQQTPVWVKARIGSVTASRVPDLMITGGKEKRRDYRAEIIYERRNGKAWEHPPNQAMIWGINNQVLAACAYEIDQRVFLTGGGYWRHDEIEWFGASPDYLVGDDGLVEIKCHFNPKYHLDHLENGEVKEEYLWQMVAQMCCTGRQWCDFVSFDPRLPENDQLFVKRFDRHQPFISSVEVEVRQFLKEIAESVERLRARK